MVVPGDFHGRMERDPLAGICFPDAVAVDQKGENAMSVSKPHWRPGDARADIRSMLRVDQAGEYGATRIYAGQLAVLGDRHPASTIIARMAVQEKRHLAHF